MAAPMPHPYQAHVPATPPPDQPLFSKDPMFADMSTTTTTTTSRQQAFFNMFAAHAQQVREQQRRKQREQDAQQQPQQQQQPTPVSSRQSSSSAPVPQSSPSQTQTNLPFGMKTTSPADPTQQQQRQQATTTIPTLDPKYLAMASRIAAYYQQRCQAIANFQQQRCQQWANMQRAKCQEMMQATMLVVAWYIRDRIERRRRKQKRVFKRGLEQRERQRALLGGKGGGGGRGGGKVTKGEVVRRWVLDVPIGVLPPSSPAAAFTTPTAMATEKGEVSVPQPSPEVHDPLQDQAEAIFALGGNGVEMPETKAEDKDSQLFTVADNLIKSQLAKIDIPLLGVLNLDESDSEESSEEGEEEEEEEEEEYYEDEYGDGDEGEDYEEEEEEEAVEFEEDREGEDEEENVGYECYGPGVYGNTSKLGPKVKVTAVPSLYQHQQEQQQQQPTKVEDAVAMSPEGMGSEEVQLGTTGSGSAGRKRGASEIS